MCGLSEAGTQDRVLWRSSVNNSGQEPTPSNGSAPQSMAAPPARRVLGMRTRSFNSLRPRLNRRPFADDIFKCILLNENVCIPINISLKFVPKGPINNIPALVQIMAWRRPGDKPLSEPMMVSLPRHICVTRPQ